MDATKTPLLDKARRCFADDRFATQRTGVTIQEAALEPTGARVVCTLPVQPELLNARGTVMGGALFTLADFAFAVAANLTSVANDRGPEWLSIDSTIHYLSAATAGSLTATTRCVKQGRTTCLFHTDITSPEGRLLATVETTGMHLPN